MAGPLPVDRSSKEQSPFEFGGRSYVSVSHRGLLSYSLPTIISGENLHKESRDLASQIDEPEDPYVLPYPPISITAEETTPFAPNKSYGSEETSLPFADIEALLSASEAVKRRSLGQTLVTPLSYIPAVFLGTLLNVLDGLSYGMIMFPISEALFSLLAPAGLSMFYISTVVSQLVYSLGGLAFRAGIGSEMIEVTPFFHSMALAILAEMKGEPDEAVIATVITTYAVSLVVTGIVFFLLGKLRLGSLVGFFPRHILVGCIGGVGYFLIVTGIEVSSRLEGGVRYNLATLGFLLHESLFQWTVPLLLTAVLVFLQHRIHNSLLVPLFFIAVFGAFHAVVALRWDLASARAQGWVFPAVENKEPWYLHYELYKFGLVSWVSLLRQFPSMLALTFFGILHVPINVPALAVTVGMDDCDVDRELVAHGFSNAILGLLGSIQNYLVYTNSVLFIRAGADSRVAGVMLAAATVAVMVAGPVIIGYIPVCVVGSLIYLLGYELLKEAVYDTRGRLRRVEYWTIIIIVVVMGAWDFVYGVLVGVLLASLSFVVDAARRSVVSGVYTGVVARSTVLRHPKHQDFLKDVGHQICIIKLQGTLFFGSIGGVEKTIRSHFDDTRFKKNPIKFLIIDMKRVSSIDFSAAEGFRRVLKLAGSFGTQLIISSVELDGEIVRALRDAGLWEYSPLEIQLFSTLNHALEWCENSFLKTYKRLQSRVPKTASKRASIYNFDDYGTPRTAQVIQAALRTARDEQRLRNRYLSEDTPFSTEPLPLIMTTFHMLSSADEHFWARLAPFFIKEKIPEGITFYDTGHRHHAFFLVELGLVRSVCTFESDDRELRLLILPNTAFGDLLELSQFRKVTYTTVTDSVLWRLDEHNVKKLLQRNGQEVYHELLHVQMKLFKERFDSLTGNLVVSL